MNVFSCLRSLILPLMILEQREKGFLQGFIVKMLTCSYIQICRAAAEPALGLSLCPLSQAVSWEEGKLKPKLALLRCLENIFCFLFLCMRWTCIFRYMLSPNHVSLGFICINFLSSLILLYATKIWGKPVMSVLVLRLCFQRFLLSLSSCQVEVCPRCWRKGSWNSLCIDRGGWGWEKE